MFSAKTVRVVIPSALLQLCGEAHSSFHEKLLSVVADKKGCIRISVAAGELRSILDSISCAVDKLNGSNKRKALRFIDRYEPMWKEIAPHERPDGIKPGDEVILRRGSCGRGPETGPGYGRDVRARYLDGNEFYVFCELLEDDPGASVPPFKAGEEGCWHYSAIRNL
ncbi:hypothetical protein [Sulfuricystis multivorans]|uniref:hypothetical protein n=1 Tax=Sulfuricystis multivorans TaxID=2211108 RepID=UPI000F82381E|nr:hypothetical protein [Sulfuricystis multivorans]